MSKKVVVAMSGGVDSSVTAALLKDAGYNVIGISLRIWNYSEQTENKFGTCCSLEDIADARRVAANLDIPFYVLNMEKGFKKKVIDYFIQQYLNGYTPNPCIACNKIIKFDALRKFALKLGAEFIATGHYASIIRLEQEKKYVIRRGIDPKKDQSYFLFNLSQPQLRQIIMPLGIYSKTEVRIMAQKYNLPVADKSDSQEICFIPDHDYGKFIQEHTKKNSISAGYFIDKQENILGKHKGIAFYTIGQRKGLGIQSSNPLYVIKIDPKSNRIILGSKEDLIKKEFWVEKVNWAIPLLDKETKLEVQIRSNHKAVPALVQFMCGKKAKVIFDTPQTAITPGQAAVFYKDNLVAGGGWICQD